MDSDGKRVERGKRPFHVVVALQWITCQPPLSQVISGGALKAVFYCTLAPAGLSPEAFVITRFYSCPLILVPCLEYSLLQRDS